MGLVLAGAASLLAACESAPVQAQVQTASAGCTEWLAPSGTAADIARRCRDRADDSDILGREAGLSYYHAATAYDVLGDSAAAADMIERSFNELATSDRWLTTPPDGLSEAGQRDWLSQRRQFQLERLMLAASAYRGLADAYTQSPTSSFSNRCSSRLDCLSKAVGHLADGEAIAARLASVSREPLYDRYHLALGELYEARNRPGDSEAAIRAYQTVASSPLAGPAPATARANLAGLTTRLADDALERGGAADIVQAIRYFNLARDADPANAEAPLGLGQIYLDGGTAANDLAQLGRAETAFSDALALSTQDSQKAAAYMGRGAARSRIASLNGTSAQGAIADYQAAAQLADSAEAFLVLARSCKASSDWQCADENFARGIARLQSENASGKALSAALLEQADVRERMAVYGPGDVRALLQQAVNAAPASGEANMELARHDMAQENWSGAEAGFKRVVLPSTTGSDLLKAEAYGALARLGASRPDGNLEQAIGYIEQAADLDKANPDYPRELCLARIYRGGSSVTASRNARTCDLGASSGSLLLQAMFDMRRAQYAGASTAAQIRRTARDHINRALDITGPDHITDYDWPLEDSLPPVKTRAILLYLKEATLACGGNYTFYLPEANGITSADYSAARDFLDFYRSRLCT